MTRIITVLLACLVWGACVARAEELALQPPVLRDVMWQVLPGSIQTVYVGPDGRMWWAFRSPDGTRDGQLRDEDLPLSVDEIRRRIEAQFHERSPILCGAGIELFEPGGRVWFTLYGSRSLWGYDGTRWIEHAPASTPENEWFVGGCPNHGSRGDDGNNIVYRGKAFFIASRGIHCLDLQTEEWSYQHFADVYSNKHNYRYPIQLVAEPDGQGLLAQYSTNFWRWTDDAGWEKPSARTMQLRSSVDQFAPAIVHGHKGVWVKLHDRMKFLTYDGTEELEPPNVIGEITFGLNKARILHYSSNGSTHMLAEEVFEAGKKIGRAILTFDKDGGLSVTPLAGDEFAKTWGAGFGHQRPVEVPGSGDIWFPGHNEGQHGCLFSPGEKRVIASLPDSRYCFFHAIADDGTLFTEVSNRQDPDSSPIVAYRPGAKDDRVVLKPERRAISGEVLGAQKIALDGTIWANDVNGKVIRFDGKEWRSVAGLANAKWFLPGNGVMLMEAKGGFHLVAGEQVYSDATLEGLLGKRHGEVAAAFIGRGAEVCEMYLSRTMLTADKTGNLWLLRNGKVKVLVDDTWIDTSAAVKELQEYEVGFQMLASVGDSSRVYMSDLALGHRNGCSLYGEIEDGQPAFMPAPCCAGEADRWYHYPVLHDRVGALWVPGIIARDCDNGACNYLIAGFEVHRLTEHGSVQTLIEKGWPLLCDKAGNVWLQSTNTLRQDEFSIWADGRVAHAMTIPFASTHNTWLISDKPGSVYAWTLAGLQHFVAEDPQEPARYLPEETYAVDGVDGLIADVGYSDLGYVVVFSQMEYPSRHFVNLIRLPEHEPKGQ